MRFEWDVAKSKSNVQKHHISFETATGVFDDPNYVTEQDREVDGEERWQTIGQVEGVMVLLVAHTIVDEQDNVTFRIISARRATASVR